MSGTQKGEESVILHNVTRISVIGRYNCCVCGKSFKRSPSRLKRYRRVFCSQKCYHSLRQDGRYVEWRQGQRRAHKAVSQYFQLQPGNVVHHHDDDNRNNDISNLAVFRNQSDHMAYHHGNPAAVPLWDGKSREVPK